MRDFSPQSVPIPPEDATKILLPYLFQPLDIEIGCGTGVFSMNYCLKNPKRCLLSIERTKNKFFQFKNHILEKNIPI